MKAVDPGVRFDETKMQMVRIEELVETDKNVLEDKRTMEELRKIANTVFQCNQFTTDSLPANRQRRALYWTCNYMWRRMKK